MEEVEEQKKYTDQILETENSDEDEMNFDDSICQSPTKLRQGDARVKQSKNKDDQPSSSRGNTMFVNGKKVQHNKNDWALNKREKSNWLVHLLFIRQEYKECLKFVDELIEESSQNNDSERSEYAIYIKALILRIKGNIHESLELFKKCHLLNPNNVEYLK